MKNRIERIRKLVSQNKVEGVEELVEEIVVSENIEDIARLFLIFSDKYEYDEIMFSVIHAIETLDDHTYVSEYLNHAEDIFNSSPRWSAILLIRILNSKNTLSILKNFLKNNNEKKKIIEKIEYGAKRINPNLPDII